MKDNMVDLPKIFKKCKRELTYHIVEVVFRPKPEAKRIIEIRSTMGDWFHIPSKSIKN